MLTIKSDVRLNGVFRQEGERVGLIAPTSGVERVQRPREAPQVKQEARQALDGAANAQLAVAQWSRALTSEYRSLENAAPRAREMPAVPSAR